MSEEPRAILTNEPSSVQDFVSEEARRNQMLRTILRLAGGAALLALLLFVAIGFVSPQFPAAYLAAIAGGFLLATLLSMWLLGRERWTLSIAVYMLGLTAASLVAMYFANGVRGPIAVVLISIPVVAGLLGGRGAARWTVVLVGVLYVIMAVLEGVGVLQPRELSGTALRVIHNVVFVLALAIVAYMVSTSANLRERALAAVQQQAEQLTEANVLAQQAALAERTAREREELAALELRQTVREYSEFLNRVAAGDYGAKLELDEPEAGGARPTILLTLGQQLNDTVEALVQALADLQAVQRRYVREAWQGAGLGPGAQRGFRYRASATSTQRAGLEPADSAWLEPMTDAIEQRQAAARERELALPLTLRGEVIGAIGVRREDGDTWSEEDIALAEAIGDQLTQTIEGLRLLDETQRRATREQLVGEVAGSFRETLDVDTVLRTAAQEIRQALGLSRMTVLLTAKSDEENRD